MKTTTKWFTVMAVATLMCGHGYAEEADTQTAYYVKVTSTGDASGSNWENAMGTDELRQLLMTSADKATSDANAAKLDGKHIYLAAGDYEIVKNNSGIKLEYSNYSKLVEISISGGYDASSTGTDLTNRDIVKNQTRLLRNTADLTATATTNALLCLGNQISLTLEGCVLDGQFGAADKGNVCGLLVGAGTSGNARLNVNDCVIKNFNRANNGNYNGAGLYLTKGQVYLNRVEFCGNRGGNRGAAIDVVSNVTNGKLFINNCLFYDNHAPGAWGTAIHSSQAWVCMNNTTVIGTPGTSTNSVTVNGDAHYLVANSTIISASGNPNGAFRSAALSSILVNSLILKGTGTRTIYKSNVLKSSGYNVFQAADADWGAIATDTDLSEVEMPEAKLTDGVYQWDYAGKISNFATAAAVIDAVKAFDATVGKEFVEWVGESGFAVDGRGEARNSDKMMPGAYDVCIDKATGLEEHAIGETVKVYTTPGAINVMAVGSTNVAVYAVNGQLVKQFDAVGTASSAVAPGLYIVKVAGGTKAYKVVVE